MLARLARRSPLGRLLKTLDLRRLRKIAGFPHRIGDRLRVGRGPIEPPLLSPMPRGTPAAVGRPQSEHHSPPDSPFRGRPPRILRPFPDNHSGAAIAVSRSLVDHWT